MEVSNEISLKIKTAIKAKLLELGIFIGEDELPDYIMVMIANKRSQEQMNEDLALFLGETTETFTSWLHGLLARLQSVASGPITVMVKPLPSTDSPSSKSPLSSASVSDSETPSTPKKAPKRKSGSRSAGSSMPVQKKNIAPKRKVTSPARNHGSVKKAKSSVLDPGSSDITETESVSETGLNDVVPETGKAVAESEPDTEPVVQTVSAEDLESGVQETPACSDIKPVENVQEECDNETEVNQALKTNPGESASPVATSGPDTDRELNLSSEIPSQSCEDSSPAVFSVKKTLSIDGTVEDSTSLPSYTVGGENNETLSTDVSDASPLAASGKEKRKYPGDDGRASPVANSDSDPTLHQTKKVKPTLETCADLAPAAACSGESEGVEKREKEETLDPAVSCESESSKQVLAKPVESSADSQDGAVGSIQHEAVKEASCLAESDTTCMAPGRESSESLKVDSDVPLLDKSKASDSEAEEQPVELSSMCDQEVQKGVKVSREAAKAEESTKTPDTFADSGAVGQGSVSGTVKHETDEVSNQEVGGSVKSSDKNKMTVTGSKADHSNNTEFVAGGSEKEKTDSGSQRSALAASGSVAAVGAGSQPSSKTAQGTARSQDSDVKDKDKQRSGTDKACVQSSSTKVTKMTASSRGKHKEGSSKGQSVSDTGDTVRDSQQHRGSTPASDELLSGKMKVKQSSAGDSGKLSNTDTAESSESPEGGQSKAGETRAEKPKIKPGNQKTASNSFSSAQLEKTKSSSGSCKSKQSGARLTQSAPDSQQPAKDSKKQKPSDAASTSAQSLPQKVKVKPSSSSGKSKQPGTESDAAFERQQDTGKHDSTSSESVPRKVRVHEKSAVGENKQQDSRQVVRGSQQGGKDVEKQRSHHTSSTADQSIPRKVIVKTSSSAGGKSKELNSNSSQPGFPADSQGGLRDSKKQKTASSASESDPVLVRGNKPAGDGRKQLDIKSAQSSSDSDSKARVRGSEKQETTMKASPASGREKVKVKSLPSGEQESKLTNSGSPHTTVSASGSVSRKESISKSANKNSVSHHARDSKSNDGAAKKTSAAVSRSGEKESKTRGESVSNSDSESRKRRSESLSSSDSSVPPHKHAKQDAAKSKDDVAPKKVSKEEPSHVRTMTDKPSKVVKSIKTDKPSSLSERDLKQKISPREEDSKGQRVSDKDSKQKSSVREKAVSVERHALISGSSKQKRSGGEKVDSEAHLASEKSSKEKGLVLEKGDSKTLKSSSVKDSKPKGPEGEKSDSKRQSVSDKDSKHKLHVSHKDDDKKKKSGHVSGSEQVSLQSSEKDSDDIARELESQGHIRRIIKLKRVA